MIPPRFTAACIGLRRREGLRLLAEVRSRIPTLKHGRPFRVEIAMPEPMLRAATA